MIIISTIKTRELTILMVIVVLKIPEGILNMLTVVGSFNTPTNS
jgi:hypothetical protein